MTSQLIVFLLALTAAGSGLIAGVFFAFSTFIMKALAQLPAGQGIGAMQSINRVILGSLFMPVFMGSAVLCILVILVWWFHGTGPGSNAALAGCTLYLVATFGFTVAFNVPLNNALAATDTSAASAPEAWTHYVSRWTLWNHVRTVASFAAAVLLAVATAQIAA
jgi:uncharacterized membrane protein